MTAKPGSTALVYSGYTLASLGLTAFIGGGTILLVGHASGEVNPPSWALPAFLGGVGATGVGIGMMYMGRSHLDEEAGDQQAMIANKAITVSGTF